PRDGRTGTGTPPPRSRPSRRRRSDRGTHAPDRASRDWRQGGASATPALDQSGSITDGGEPAAARTGRRPVPARRTYSADSLRAGTSADGEAFTAGITTRISAFGVAIVARGSSAAASFIGSGSGGAGFGRNS